MELAPVRVVAGLGWRSGVEAEAVLALLGEAMARAACRPALLAIPAFKRREPAIDAAASRLGLTLLAVSRDRLRAEQPRCVTRSGAALEAVGLSSVAEACALAACGPASRLILARIAGAGVTCALAAVDTPAR